MATKALDSKLQEFLRGRHIATLSTENADGSAHLVAVWYLYDGGSLYVATSSKSKKARNVAARAKASMMIDERKPGKERGVTGAGKVELITGGESRALNKQIHGRYMSVAAMADPGVGGVFAMFDDCTIKVTPSSWFSWDMAELDAQAFGGKLGKTPGYLLALD